MVYSWPLLPARRDCYPSGPELSEDLARLPLDSANQVKVLHVTPADQIDPTLMGRSYYAA